jgi:hypothetical protein
VSPNVNFASYMMPRCSVLLTLLGIGMSWETTSTQRAAAAPLLPQDHTILWPLKFSADKDTVFQMAGDGFCNAPSVLKDRVVDLATFQQITRIAFNSSGSLCQPRNDLEDLAFQLSPAELLSQKIPLVLAKGIPPTVCDPALWSVVAMRADPCHNITENLKTGAVCEPQVRLVLQPFETSQIGVRVVRDFTIHLVYKVPDWSKVQNALEAVADVSRVSESKTPWEPQFDGKKILRPHHGLRNELGRCDGPVSKAVKKFVADHTRTEDLEVVAAMGSSFAVKEWTFWAYRAQGSGAQKQIIQVPVNGLDLDNFSDSLFTKGQYSLTTELLQNPNLPSVTDQITKVAANQLQPADKAAGIRQKLFAEMQEILNPRRISQTGANCTSCHLAPQTLQGLAALYGAAEPDAGVETFKATVWPGFNPKARSFVHLRNLGYGPQFNLSINRRTINEVMLVQEWVEKKGNL